MAKIIPISLAKGGIGKTHVAVNLSAALALSGKKVLLADIDPQQGNATLSLGYAPSEIKFTVANIINSVLDFGQVEGFEKAIIKVSEALDLLPANPKLETIQNRLIAERSNVVFASDNTVPAHCVLKEIFVSVGDKYDYIIIDCPPGISMLTINAMVAADSVIIPMEAHYESFEALRQTLDVISRIKANWNPQLAVEGIIITKYQSRTKLCREVSDYTTLEYGDKLRIFNDNVPFSIKAAELTSLGVSIFDYAPQSEIATAFSNIAGDVIRNV